MFYQKSESEISPNVEEFQTFQVLNVKKIHMIQLQSDFAKLVVCVYQSGEEILPLEMCAQQDDQTELVSN